MEFNQSDEEATDLCLFWHLFSSSIEASSTYEFHQMHSERRLMVSGHLLMFVYPHQGELCDDVTSTQYRVESYNMCQTGMGASLCLLIHLMASWPEYLSYCKCWPVSLNQLKDDEECSLSAPLWYAGAHSECIDVCCFKGVFTWGWGRGWGSQSSLIQI